MLNSQSASSGSARSSPYTKSSNNGSSDSSTTALSKSSILSTDAKLRDDATTEERLKATPTPLDSLFSSGQGQVAETPEYGSSTDLDNSKPWQAINGSGATGTGAAMACLRA